MPKRSENAKAVAREVRERVRNGKKVILGEIIKNHGYSEAVSVIPQRVTQTKSYQEEIQPFVLAMVKERDKALKEAKKKRGKAQYHQLIEAVDKLNKNIQLLTGGRTGDETIVFNAEQVNIIARRTLARSQ